MACFRWLLPLSFHQFILRNGKEKGTLKTIWFALFFHKWGNCSEFLCPVAYSCRISSVSNDFLVELFFLLSLYLIAVSLLPVRLCFSTFEPAGQRKGKLKRGGSRCRRSRRSLRKCGCNHIASLEGREGFISQANLPSSHSQPRPFLEEKSVFVTH